jgi:RES domain
MVGEVEPLKALQDASARTEIITRILNEYPSSEIAPDAILYRIRKEPKRPEEFDEYDSPPIGIAGSGMPDSADFPVLYCSQDLQVCIHELRATAEDDLFVATLVPTKKLKVLDVAELLWEEDATEFDSLDLAVHMLFLAGSHSYEISRAIALAAHAAGFDGLIYSSYFSMLRTGAMPLETTFGISHRRVRGFVEREKSKIIRNLALFGRPVEEQKLQVKCINRLILSRVSYGVHFGPVGCQPWMYGKDGYPSDESSSASNVQEKI